jgi:hypothetical protein
MAERLGVTCTHCREINFTDEPHYPRCHSCGHRCDAPRYLCKCDRCTHMRENLGMERRKADGTNS